MQLSASDKVQSDRYEVVARLGEGGMATVLLARDHRLDRWCALKVLLPKLRDQPTIRARFEAEGHAMMGLQHRNVIDVYDVQTDGPEPFFVMELAEAGSLADWIAAHGPMPPRLAAEAAVQICKGMAAVHAAGIIHRDIKPQNIMVTRRGTCKIADFGVAHIEGTEALNRPGALMGTLEYIAPEQRTNASAVDERADIYSVGATLYAMLTGSSTADLFFADNEPEMMAEVPELLVPLLRKATREDPEERFRGVMDLGRALHDLRNALPADPPSTPILGGSTLDGLLEGWGGVESAQEADESDTGGQHASIPSIPRRQLLRTAESRNRVARPVVGLDLERVLLGLAPLAALLVVLTGLTFAAKTSLDRHQAALAEADARVEKVLSTERALLFEEMAGIGVPESELDAAWAALQAAPRPRRTEALIQFATRLNTLGSENEPLPGTVEVHLARKAETRRAKLADAVNARSRWEHAYKQQATTSMSRLAITLGLASGPEL